MKINGQNFREYQKELEKINEFLEKLKEETRKEQEGEKHRKIPRRTMWRLSDK